MIEYLTDNEFALTLLKTLIIFGGVLGAVAYLSWLERKLMARVQMRPGPTRVGPFGLLQPIADGLEVPVQGRCDTDRRQSISIFCGAGSFPCTRAAFLFGHSVWSCATGDGPQHRAAFILAITSLGVYGIVLGGWASNSKYPLMGAMRSSAQMISYELSLTLSIVGVLMISNTLSLARPHYVATGNMAGLHSEVEHLPAAGCFFHLCH